MRAPCYNEDKSAAAFARHAELAQAEKANPVLLDCPLFQQVRHDAYLRFLSLFSGATP